MHEKLIHELEEERHLRLQSEKRLREVTLESERSRVQMRGLQQQFSRMEETVRNLLQNQGPPEGKKEETVNIIVYQEKLSEEERKHKETLEDPHMLLDEDSRSESSSTDEGKEKTKLLLERLKALEAENSALALENENQREQYERCLDEVANQVVQALLTQKDLREECVKLKTRVFDLEQQNRTLSVLFQQRVKPASDLLLQKLHSRILDLSSGDLLSEVERNQSLMQSRTDVDIHECQLNAKSGVPVPKCPALNMTSSGQLCPRNSCSSSELSLSSTCSEYSSGSSYTWNDGKTLGKRSSINWDKRISIASSLPSDLASPADELPPTRIKESHILEGLRKLQKRKVLLEPPSVITKWGYKDCMNSNEGIYSPGIKCGSQKEQPQCTPREAGSTCKEQAQAFTYDSDSHDDADDEASSLALQLEIPNKDHTPHCNKLTHSISDSLFGWESSGKNFSENTPSADFKEKPEKLTNFGNNCISEGELCPNMQLQQEKDMPDLGHMDMNLQLSDTDDYETLDELHIESSDEKSPSDLLIAPGTQTFDILIEHGKSQLASSSKEEKRASIPSNSRPKTFSFIKQQRVIKKTSSEECITVIFDAEDGEPIEFSSHQTGVVTVTRNEISINPAPTGPNAEYTELLPQGITNLQLGMNARDYTILKAPEDEREKRTHKDIIGTGTTGVLVMPTESLSPGRSIIENTHLQKETKSTHNTAYRSNSVSSVSMGMSHKQNLTKIPSRGKSLPQKSKVTDPDGTSIVSSPSSVVLEKSPALPPVKLSKFQKTQSPVHRLHLQPDSHIPKQPKLPPSSSKNPIKNDCIKGSKSSLLLPRPLITPSVYGEPPTKDKHCILGQEEIVKSPSPPPPPGRSASLLIRPNYEHSPPSSGKPGTNVPSEMAKTTLKSSPLKAFPSAIISSSQSMPEVQGKKSVLAFKKPDFSHPSSNEEKVVQGRCSSQLSSGTFAILGPSPLKVSPKRGSTKVFNHQVSGKNQGFSDTGLQTTKNIPLGCGPLEMPSSKSSSPGRRGQCSDCLPKSLKSHPISGNQSMSSQVNSPSSSPSSKSHDSTNNTQGSHDKGPKTRLPVGLKVLVKSPQLLRKSSTVPGKQEKESINAASKSCAAASKSKPEDSVDLTRLDATSGELNVSMADLDVKSSFASELTPENILLQSPMTCHIETDRGDVLENRFMKRSTSSNKPHLKPALGMNGAKARSQSFSIHSGEKSSTAASEVLGKVRTQIITNTTDRGNSLTRQNSATDGFTNKTVSGSITENLSTSSKPLEDSYSPQGSHGSTNSSGSQHGSPSKLPFRISTKTEEIHSTSRVESHKLPSQGNCPTIALPEEQGNGPYRCLPSPSSPSHLLEQASSLQSPRRIQCMGHLEANSAHKQEIHGMPPVTSEIGNVSQDASVPPTIEEKVMLCIQENVEKGQAQGPTIEAKQKTGPSIASWFGFRRSKLPALSGRKMDISKTKMEKKDAKSLGFGNKQQKVEKKKDKRKPELQCETENEFNRKPEMGDVPDGVLKNKRSVRIPQDIHVQMKFEQRNRLSPVTCSAKDTFMKELLNRVDKKTAQQTENGSNNVSSRSMSKGNSQGSTLPSNSISTQGNQKKNSKTKADMETPNETLIKEVTENLQEDEEDTIMESGGLSSFQSHIIESSCQMRTLDSGIGTFPLPDSGNRSTGRHACKPDTSVESEPFLSLQETLPSAPPIKAKTLEREVPSAANSQGSLESIIVHSTSDPVMTAKGIRPFQSRLPKPASSGINHLQRQNETELSPQASFEYSGKTMENETNLPDWNSDKTTKTQQQKLKQVEETKEDSENRLSKISLESLNKLNSNSVILLEKEKNCLNKVERQREEKGKNEDTSLKSSSRPGVDNLESLSDSLYDSFSSCASQGSNDV